MTLIKAAAGRVTQPRHNDLPRSRVVRVPGYSTGRTA